MKLNSIDNIKIINLEQINTDTTNMFIFDHLDKIMKVKRVFFISSNDKSANKGFHAHKIDNQIISCIHGQITLTIKDGKNLKNITLYMVIQNLRNI